MPLKEVSMSSSNSLLDCIGRLVWVFPRNDVGLPIGNSAVCGLVVDIDDDKDMLNTIYVVQVGDNYYNVWEGDIELVEEWDEELERKNGSVEGTDES